MEVSNYPIISIAVFIIITLLLVIFVFVKMRRRKGMSMEAMQYIQSHWIRIIDSFNSHPKNAILDADKLLDYALSKHGFEGNLGEKLKKAGPRFKDLNGAWSAHKLRNRVAHELEEIDKDQAKRALKQFKSALNDLGAEL